MAAALFALAGGIALAACQWLVLAWTPVEMTLGIAQKIFYMHMPLALWSLISFFLVFAGSVLFLWRRRICYDLFCAAASELGVLFSGLALISGMIWAKKSWGVWWTWDPRLVTTLVMWFIYSAYLLVRHLEMSDERRRIISAVLGVAAFLDVPLVFMSARIFRSIHPAVFGAKGGGLEPEMWLATLCCIIAFGLLWTGLLLFRFRQLDIGQRLGRLKIKMLEKEL